MHKILVKFPNPDRNERQKYYELMRGFFSQLVEILKYDRISLEIHRNGEFIEILLLVSNKNLVKPITAYLTSIEGTSIEEMPESYEPLAIYEVITPYFQRPYLEHDYTSLNLQDKDFLRRLVDYLASLSKNEYGGVVCLIQPSQDKTKEIKREIQKRDELAEYELGHTNLNTERHSLQSKISSNLFQVQFYCIGSDKHIATGLSSVFHVLNGENRFIIEKFFTGKWENIKKRYIAKPSAFSNIFSRKYLGSYLNADELATIFTPAGVDRGRYKQQEITVLEARPNFLESRADNILIGESMLKTGIKTDVYFPLENLERHIYLAGKTGMGKSTLMIQLFLSILKKQPQKSLCLLDPHGSDLIEIAKRMDNWDDLVYFNLAENQEKVFTMNPLFSFGTTDKEKETKVEALMLVLMEEAQERNQTLGTSLEKLLYLLIETGVHFADAYFLFLTTKMKMSDEEATKQVNEKQITFPDLPNLLKDTMNYKQLMMTVFRSYPNELSHKWNQGISEYMISKPILDGVENRLRFIIKSSLTSIFEGNKFKISDLIKQGKKILIPITEQSFGSSSKRIIGKLILSEIWAQTQMITREEDRHEVVLFIDEFQEAQMPIIDDLLAQARKYKVRLVLGNQYLGQLDKEIKESVLGNVSTIFSFNTGNAKEAREIRPFFKDKLEAEELMSLPPFTAYMRTNNPYEQDTAFMSFKTVDYKEHIPEKRTFEDLQAHNDFCLDKYGEDIANLNHRHLLKIKDAENYFLED